MSGRCALALAAALGASPGCVTFSDEAGVPVPADGVSRVTPGVTTRAEVLELFGPPTGVFIGDLRDVVFMDEEVLQDRATQGRLDEQALTWQKVEIEGWVAFFPVLFAFSKSTVLSRTLTVFFDGDGVVVDAAYREDRP